MHTVLSQEQDKIQCENISIFLKILSKPIQKHERQDSRGGIDSGNVCETDWETEDQQEKGRGRERKTHKRKWESKREGTTHTHTRRIKAQEPLSQSVWYWVFDSLSVALLSCQACDGVSVKRFGAERWRSTHESTGRRQTLSLLQHSQGQRISWDEVWYSNPHFTPSVRWEITEHWGETKQKQTPQPLRTVLCLFWLISPIKSVAPAAVEVDLSSDAGRTASKLETCCGGENRVI